MLCSFQVHGKVIQSCMGMYLFFFRFFSYLGHDRMLRRAPCSTQQVLTGCLFYTELHSLLHTYTHSTCVYVSIPNS